MTVQSTTLTDPLPKHFITDDEGIGGRIKVRPEDFLVDELPLYDPCGKGEHIYLGVEKIGISHAELISAIREHFNVPETAVGYAGMKDKRGITRQTISIHLPKDPPAVEFKHEKIRVLWASRHRNKIRRGHLSGNRFSIRIRETDPLRAPAARRVLHKLEQSGVPTYYGPQRFGYRRNTHLLGAALLKGDWRGVHRELLGTAGSSFPEYQRERREYFDAGRYPEALAQWSASDRSERAVLRALISGADDKTACFAVGKTAWSFWISAVQSAIFNRVVDERIAAGTFDRLEPGDLAWKHDSRRVFRVTEDELASGELAARLANLEISPSGPLWGANMTPAEGEPGRREREVLDASGLSMDLLAGSPLSPDGARRPLREPLRHPEIDAGVDEHGGYIRVAFDLPRGTYATVVLREILKSDEGLEA